MSDRKTFKTASDRLKAIIDKKFETCFIFPLAEFEKEFGELWGHGFEKEQLNEDEIEMREKWERVRINILNKGNVLRRSIVKELDLHEIKYIGYHMEFKIGVGK